MELLTDQDIMSRLSIKDKRTLRSYRRKGLDFIKVGQVYRYTQDMLDNFLIKNSSLIIKNPKI